MKPDCAPLVLFICTGNQIRSPIAMAIFQQRLIETGLQDSIRVDSAGTWTIPGRFDLLARKAALKMGLNIEEHRSKMVERELLSEARLIIVMEQGQKEGLEVENPQVRGKIKLLSQLAGDPPYNIPDPSGEELEVYLQTGEELLKLINSGFDSICQIVQEK